MPMAAAQPQSDRHLSVLRDEAVAALNITASSVVVDATYGRGGHTRAIMGQLGDQGRMLVIDRDPTAIARAKHGKGIIAFDADHAGNRAARFIGHIAIAVDGQRRSRI